MEPNQSGGEAAPNVPKKRNAGVGAGRPCKVCAHPRLAEIDEALIVGGMPGDISRKFELSYQSLWRHRRDHIPNPAMREGAQAVADEEGARGASLMEGVLRLRHEAEAILREARGSGQLDTALRAIDQSLKCLTTMAKLTGDLSDVTQINIAVAPVMVSLQAAILRALLPFPEARSAVVAALGALDTPQLTVDHAPLLTVDRQRERNHAEI